MNKRHGFPNLERLLKWFTPHVLRIGAELGFTCGVYTVYRYVHFVNQVVYDASYALHHMDLPLT